MYILYTSELEILKSEKVTALSYPAYSPDLAPCDFFLCFKVKKFLSGRRYKPEYALSQSAVCASNVYLNQRTVTPSEIEIIYLNQPAVSLEKISFPSKKFRLTEVLNHVVILKFSLKVPDDFYFRLVYIRMCLRYNTLAFDTRR